MVRAFDRSMSKSSLSIKKMFENPGRQAHSTIELRGGAVAVDERQARSFGGGSAEVRPVGNTYVASLDKGPVSRLSRDGGAPGGYLGRGPSDLEVLKEKFAKLLLGEDMSGGGKGVSSALALSNAITNLSASVFGETKKLEPMAPERKARWRKEVDWLLSVTDHIVELVPSQQQNPDGSTMEIMITRQRRDLLVNIPALRKLDAMLLDCLDKFRGQSEFGYVDAKDTDETEKASGQRENDKWWIPTVKVPQNGLSEMTRKWMQYQKDCVNQVLKAAMAINAHVLTEMEIPESYIDSLPKNGRSTLGDHIYKSVTDEFFDPDGLLTSMDLTSEHKAVDLKNKIEASIVIWKRKITQKDGKSSWSSAISMEKRELLEERAETLLLILKHRFPGIPQSTLDISKIQYNRDVGHAVLESYSRVLESLAASIMNRIEDVFYVDSQAQKKALAEESAKLSSPNNLDDKKPSTPNSRTLLDFMGWSLDQGDEPKKKESDDLDEYLNEEEQEKLTKTPPENKRLSYLERLEHWGGLRSPTARH